MQRCAQFSGQRQSEPGSDKLTVEWRGSKI